MNSNVHCYEIDYKNSINGVNLRRLQPGRSTDVSLLWNGPDAHKLVVKAQRYKDEHEDCLRIIFPAGREDDNFSVSWHIVGHHFGFDCPL